jgi:hypothetical protein
MKQKYPELTYAKSENGQTIQVHLPAIDEPVKRYHPEGNLRYTKNRDGSWTPAGDSWACNKVYKEVNEEFNQQYTKTGCMQFTSMNGYTTTESHDKDGNLILMARKW